jgi:hypothetical protein
VAYGGADAQMLECSPPPEDDVTTSQEKRVLGPLQIATIQVTGGGDAAPDEAVCW